MLKKFFLLCSGVDKDVIASCSNGEQNKYAGIGGTVFFTAVMAFIASSYALFTVFDNGYIAVGFGIVWGLLIFNLDRFIVSTLRKRNNFKRELFQATPRIILAFIIAIVISKPLELKIFEKEIDTVLLQEKNQLALQHKNEVVHYFQKDLDKNQAGIDSLKSEISKKEKEVNDLYAVYITEAEGTAGTKKIGKGPVYKEKREKHDLALRELDTLKAVNSAKIKHLEEQSKQLQSELQTKVVKSQPVIEHYDGLMARINALEKLPFWPSFFIMLLFLAVETAPVLVKLIASKSEYDFKLEDFETRMLHILEFNRMQEITQSQVEKELQEKLQKDVISDEGLYGEKRKGLINILKEQSNTFNENQQKMLRNF